MTELVVAAWSAWQPGVETREAWRGWAEAPVPASSAREPAAPPAAEVPPMLRRRCDALSRALLHVAGACCAPELRAEVATVFATRFGPLGAVVENLEALAAGQPLSPTTFSHAVHNTALGLYSIWTGNRAPGSAIAAGEATFAHGWLEAMLLLRREPARPVLLVAGDAAVPPAVAPLAPGAAGAHALALLLRSDGDGERIAFALADAPEVAGDAPLPWPLAFLRWWLAGDAPTLALAHAGRGWRWERRGAQRTSRSNSAS
jgi:hypothetical protein